MELMDRYQQAVYDLLYKVRTTQREAIQKAGIIVAEAIKNGGRIYLSDICHFMQWDLLNRGGGPAYYQPYKDGETELKKGDVLFVSSVSGRTMHVVELAYECMQKGVQVIAFTSMEYAQTVDSVHSSGKKLYEFVTHTLDNCAPAAEAMVEVEGSEAKFAAASGIASVFIMWSITAVTVEKMIADGYIPGIFKSANFPGGMEQVEIVRKHYEEFGW